MQVKFSSDVVPLSDLKVNLGKIVTQTVETQRSNLLTSRRRGVAIVQSLVEYESREKECAFLRAVAQGLTEANEGKTLSIEDETWINLMKISITESAYQDLADIHQHYMLDGIEHIGKKHINEVFPKIDILNDHPKIGRIFPECGVVSNA